MKIIEALNLKKAHPRYDRAWARTSVYSAER